LNGTALNTFITVKTLPGIIFSSLIGFIIA